MYIRSKELFEQGLHMIGCYGYLWILRLMDDGTFIIARSWGKRR